MKLGLPAAIMAILFSALVTATPTRALAQKPVVLVTLSNLDELFGDFGYMAENLGFAQVGQMGTMMAGQFTEGLDSTKPIGVVVTNENGEMKPLVMLPIKDLKQFLAGLEEQIGEPRDAGEGILELAGPVPVYVKEKGGWAYVSQTTDDLEKVHPDPMKLLGNIAGKYDISIRAYVQNIPEEYREMAIAQIREGVEMQLDSLPESDETDAQRKMIENAIKQYEDLFEGLDRMTIGIGIEPEGQKAVIDMNMTSVPGTTLAKRMDLMNDLKSRFGGFLMNDAAVTFQGIAKMLPEDAENTLSSLDAVTPQIMNGIDDDDNIGDVEKDAIKKIAATLLDAFRDTVKTGKIDMGMALLLEQKFAMVAGMGVADGAKVEAAIKDASEAIDSDKVTFNLGADQHAGVRMHKMSIKTPEGDEKAQQLIGENLDVTFGIADKSVYVAAGDKAAEYLRKAIDSSASVAGKNVLPMRMRVSVAEIMKFVKQFDDDDTIAAIVDELAKVGDEQGHIVMVAKPIPAGAQYRFEVREGVFKAIGRAIEANQAEAAAF